MRRIIKASLTTESDMNKLLDEAERSIAAECIRRGQQEYVDDVKWGSDRFEVPVFVSPSPYVSKEVTKFKFVYDPDDEDYPDPADQMHVRLDEFIQDWNYTDPEDSMTGDDFIHDVLNDVVYECWRSYKGTKSEDQIIPIVKKRLQEHPYNLVEGEDFDEDDIAAEIDEYFWD